MTTADTRTQTHTPRIKTNWRYGPSLGNSYNVWAGDGGPFSDDSQYVCRVDGPDSEAVARLLSQAPAMLAALKDMVTGCEMQGIRLLGHDAAVEAIRKAEHGD